MTQTTINRRKALAVVAAVPAAVAFSGEVMLAKATPSDDPLLKAIGRYKAEVAAIDARHDDLSDEDIDAWVDHAHTILTEAVALPGMTAAGAVAVIDLVIDEEDIGKHSIYGDQFLALVKAARDYIASTAT